MSNSDSELEEDEEEILVYVEFDDCATNDMFRNENLKLDMLGLDSEHPVMQVNGKFFEGNYEDAVGTYLFFEKDDNPHIDDPIFDKIPTIKYKQKTRKLLRMQRAFVIPRAEVIGDSQHEKCIPNLETIKEAGVPPKYQEEALEFWNDTRTKRVDAISQYLKKQEFRKELRLRGFEPESDSDEDHPYAMYKYLAKDTEEIAEDIQNEENVDLSSQIENLENSLQNTELNPGEIKKISPKLTVIDPGPSTSKSSMPWVEDSEPNPSTSKNGPDDQNSNSRDSSMTWIQNESNNDDDLEKTMSQKVKSVGKVKEKTKKGKVQKKTGKKKRSSVSQTSEPDDSLEQSVETNEEESVTQKISESSDNESAAKKAKKSTIKKIRIPKFHKVEQMEIDEVVDESGRLLSEELGMGDAFVSDKERRKQEKREAKMREISEKLKALSQSSSQPNS